jgi:hypothetical protein
MRWRHGSRPAQQTVFNLMFPPLPDDGPNFAELVVPEFQRQGLTRKEYASGTLRDRLGLPRPANCFH